MQFRAVARGAHLADSMRWPRIVAWITECLWRAYNRTVAVIDSCEIPAKHNYNNSAAADQRGIGSRPPITRLLTLLCILCRDVRGWGEGISVVFHLANSRNSSSHVSPLPPFAREGWRGEKAVISTRKFLAAEADALCGCMMNGFLPIARPRSRYFFVLRAVAVVRGSSRDELLREFIWRFGFWFLFFSFRHLCSREKVYSFVARFLNTNWS